MSSQHLTHLFLLQQMPLQNGSSQGFTRILYDNGYKFTMVYPPGWRQGDSREPEVHKERCVPGPSDPRIANGSFFSRRPRREFTTRQPRTADTRSPHPVSLDSSASQAQDSVWSHSLRVYLSQSWLPKYALGPQVNTSVRYEWPFLPTLVRIPYTRTLHLVERIFDFDLHHAVVVLKEVLGDVRLTRALMEQGQLADLTLPDAICCMLDEDSVQFLDGCRPNTPADVTKVLQAYPLRTVLKTMKLFLTLPDDDEVCTYLKFDDVNHLCPVQNKSLFDLIAMPGVGQDELSLLIVVVPSWDIRESDLEEFTRVGIPDRDINLTDSATTFVSPSSILWAIIWDMCLKHKCRHFVLTNYDHWVFGALSPDMHHAHVTTHLRAPVFRKDASVSAMDLAQECFPIPTVLETLLLWLFAATDVDNVWWSLPQNSPRAVASGEQSI